MTFGEQRFNVLKSALGAIAGGAGIFAACQAESKPTVELSKPAFSNKPSVEIPFKHPILIADYMFRNIPFSPDEEEDFEARVTNLAPVQFLPNLRAGDNYLCDNQGKTMTLGDFQAWIKDNTAFQRELRRDGIKRLVFLGDEPVPYAGLTEFYAKAAVREDGKPVFSGAYLKDRFGPVQDMKFKLGDGIGTGRVTMGIDGPTNIAANYYNVNTDRFWPIVAISKDTGPPGTEGEKGPDGTKIDVEATREDCCNPTRPPREEKPKTPVPPRIVVAPPTSTPTEVPPPPAGGPTPALPYLVPFTPTPVPPPGQPGQPGGQPGPGPGPEAPTQAPLQPTGIVATPEKVATQDYKTPNPPGGRPLNTPFPQNPTAPARSGTAQSPQTRMIMIDQSEDKQVYWLTWEK